MTTGGSDGGVASEEELVVRRWSPQLKQSSIFLRTTVFCSLDRNTWLHSAPWWWWCSVAKLHPILCNSMDCSTPGFPVLHYLPEFAKTDIH